MGYLATTILDAKVTRVPITQLGSLLFLTLSAVFGIFLVVNRLIDFRLTMRLVSLRGVQSAVQEAGRLEKITKCLGNWSWRLFWLQVGTFCFGIMLFALFVVIAAFSKFTISI